MGRQGRLCDSGWWVSLPLILCCFSTPVLGELTQCDGVWTNKPCEGARVGGIAERQRPLRLQSEIDLDRKKLLIHDLEMRAISARRDYSLEIGLLAERALCLSQESSIAECEAAVDTKRKELEERSLAAAKLRATQAGAPLPGHDSGTSGVDKPTVVTIIQESSTQDNPRHRRRDGKREDDKRSHPVSSAASGTAPVETDVGTPRSAVDRILGSPE